MNITAVMNVGRKIMDEVIECPRCGSREVTPCGPNDSDLLGFVCNGKCLENLTELDNKHDCTYFQYDTETQEYAWPAKILYVLHQDDLEAFRIGKTEPRIC